jgi:5-methylthioadenosine/S-adenosylhomocysteine deaminase
MAGLVHTLADPDYSTWPTAREILSVLFAGGARALHPKAPLGSITPGAEADIILLDLDSLAFTPLNDLRRQLVYCENGGSVHTTIVAGQVVVEAGRVTTVDERAVKAEARALAAAYAADQADAIGHARELETHYREMVLRAHRHDVGFNRRLAHWSSNLPPTGPPAPA